MLLLLLMGLVLAGASASLVARAVVMPRLRASGTLGQIDSYGFASKPDEEAGASAARTALDRVATRVGGIAGQFAGFREASLRRSLVAAGIYGLAPRKFLGYQDSLGGLRAGGMDLAGIDCGIRRVARGRRDADRAPRGLDGPDDDCDAARAGKARRRSTTSCRTSSTCSSSRSKRASASPARSSSRPSASPARSGMSCA